MKRQAKRRARAEALKYVAVNIAKCNFQLHNDAVNVEVKGSSAQWREGVGAYRVRKTFRKTKT